MVVVIAQANRGPGLIDTGNQDIAPIIGGEPQAGMRYILTALMQAADIVDPTLVIPFAIYLDSLPMYSATWHGNTPDRDGVVRPPTYWYAPGDFLPTSIRLTADLPKRLPFGLDLTTAFIIR